MKKAILVLLAVVANACGSSPMAVTPIAKPATVATIQYAINVPSTLMVQQLQQAHPNGVQLSPIEAQLEFDYRCQYRGAPNVYWGPTAPPQAVYQQTGITVAPVSAAGKLTFGPEDWPAYASANPGITAFTWLGQFTYAQPYLGLPAAGVCP